ncbi:MAG: ATP-binding protein, partial [Actinomycetota bacterium]|nr:ATP-binding protein [Actinomycetota bacterium]
LCSNAVRHASGAPGSVTLRAWAESDTIVIEVSDDGSSLVWPDDVSDELPDPDAEQGRGLFLVRELVDEVMSRLQEGRTVVRVVKRAVIGIEGSPTGVGPAGAGVSVS